MSPMLDDVRHAARQLRHSPGFTLAAVLVLALGIGVGTAMSSVVNTVLLRPLPYARPARLVRITALGSQAVSMPVIQAWRQRAHSFQAIAFWTAKMVTLQHHGRTDLVENESVSNNLFPMLGLHVARGRGFSASDFQRKVPVAIVSYAFWRLFLNDNPDVLGQQVSLDGKTCTIIGILPAHVSFPPGDAVLFTPFVPTLADLQWNSPHLETIGRLRDGVPIAAARTEIGGIESALAREHSGTMGLPEEVKAVSLRTEIEGHIRPALGALSAATVLIWLIACLSVAGLLLTRFARRRCELAVRTALGAGRWQLLRPLLAESVLLGAMASAAGWALAAGGLKLLDNYIQRELPSGLNHVHAGGSALWGLLGITLISVLAMGVAPALAAAATSAQSGLREGGNAASRGRGQSRLGDGIIISEVTLALLLLAGAGLLLRSLYALRSVPLGFATRNIVTTPLRFPPHMFAHHDLVASFDRPLLARIRALPGVTDAALSSAIPLQHSLTITMNFSGGGGAGSTIRTAMYVASPDFPRVFGIPLLRGRFFNASLDTTHTPQVMVVNQAFAAKFFPGQKLIGSKKTGFPTIGILANVHGRAVGLPPQPAIYFSTSQLAPGHNFYRDAVILTDLAVRSRASAAATIAGIRAVLHQLAPEVVPEGFATMQELVNRSIGNQIFAAHLLTLFALAALAIALAGLYGLLAYAVTQRTRELGIRMALGAERGDIIRLVLGRAVWLLGIGIVIGLALAYALAHLLASYLYQVRAHDPWSLAAAAVLLALCGLWAAWLPARRAARVSPLEALRTE